MRTLLQISVDDNGQARFFSDFASFETPVSQQITTRQQPDPYSGPNPEVAEDLILWRRAKAREEGVPAYFILHQKVLYAIADLKPVTLEELQQIPGLGEKKMEKYGQDILEITTL